MASARSLEILVTGGAGYIGTHTCVELLAAGHRVTVVDNLCNGSERALERAQAIAGRKIAFVHADLRDAQALARVFAATAFDAVIHFAGLKAVGESVEQPLRYYENNLLGTLRLLEAMQEAKVRRIVFSSSATVYGDPASVPIREDFPLSCSNPYGRTKLYVEEMLRDQQRADPRWDVVLLRYFNPVGAHPSGRIGEDPAGVPNNLLPYVSQVAVGRLECLNVWGNDYPTPDGTGVRDYLHVVDLALGHLAALAHPGGGGVRVYNLGTGRGYSVLEMIAAFEQACGHRVAYRIAPRRPGDVASCYADPALAARELGWTATRGIEAMCADAWRWQSQNPNGYRD
jgi:UDP-glucose 4-epimerase